MVASADCLTSVFHTQNCTKKFWITTNAQIVYARWINVENLYSFFALLTQTRLRKCASGSEQFFHAVLIALFKLLNQSALFAIALGHLTEIKLWQNIKSCFFRSCSLLERSTFWEMPSRERNFWKMVFLALYFWRLTCLKHRENTLNFFSDKLCYYCTFIFE